MSCQITLVFLCGILLYQTGSRWWMLPAVVLSVVLFCPLIAQRHYRECMLRGGLLFAACILGAGCQVHAERIWQSERQALFREQQVSVCGTLICKEEHKKGWQLTLALPDYENRVIVSTQDGGYPLNCILSVKGPVREFDIPRNEGQFNQRQYYKCRRIMGQIIADEIRPVELPRGIRTWRECLYLLRVQMSRVYEACLPETSAGMVAAMVTGEKALLDADVRRMFQQAGFSHILAISGVKTLKLDIPLVPETRINWAFVPLHIAIIYILKLCLDEEIIPRCRFPCSRGYFTKCINWQKKQ